MMICSALRKRRGHTVSHSRTSHQKPAPVKRRLGYSQSAYSCGASILFGYGRIGIFTPAAAGAGQYVSSGGADSRSDRAGGIVGCAVGNDSRPCRPIRAAACSRGESYCSGCRRTDSAGRRGRDRASVPDSRIATCCAAI